MRAPNETINLTFLRENDGKLVFIRCKEKKGFLLSHKHGLGSSVRRALTELLQLSYRERGTEAEIFLPDSINRKTFEAVVKLRSRAAAE